MKHVLTASQTVGPFFHFALNRPEWSDLTAGGAKGEKIRIEGQVLDGDGNVIMDFPCSYGEGDLDRNVTRSGIHVVTEKYEDFYAGIEPYTREDYHADLMRVTNGRTDPVLSRILVDNSKDTVFWMNRTGGIRMEPATTLSAVRKGNRLVWARGLVIRAEHEGVGLSRSWFATAERMGIEVRYSSAATALLLPGAALAHTGVGEAAGHLE